MRDGVLSLPKIGALKIRWHRPLPEGARLLHVTVSEDAAGRWFVSLTVEDSADRTLPRVDAVMGIDLGLTSLMALSTGEKIANPRQERLDRKKLRRAQQALSRKQKDSRNREKARLRVARVHARIADRRRDHLHKLTTRLVHENQVIAVEDLNVQGMMANGSLARSIGDASWSELIRMLEYKSDRYGRTLAKVDRWYPSTKTCSGCGHLMTSMPLSVRVWTCPSCGADHDRDVNAARNILSAGLAAATPVEGT